MWTQFDDVDVSIMVYHGFDDDDISVVVDLDFYDDDEQLWCIQF
jgi:hypothetical protein